MTNTTTAPTVRAYATPTGIVVPIIVNGYDDFYTGTKRGQSLVVAGRTGNRMRLHTGYLGATLRAYVDSALARGATTLLIRCREDLKDLVDASECTRDAYKDALVESDDDPETDGERRMACDPI